MVVAHSGYGDGSCQRRMACNAAAVGFLLGIGFLLLIDELTPHLHIGTDKSEGMRSHLSKTAMPALAESKQQII